MRDFVILELLLLLAFDPIVNGQAEFPTPQGHAQDESPGLINIDEGQHSEETVQHWVNLQENPLDLNQITSEELQSLSLLSISQIKNFLNYIKIHGKLISIYELQAIPEFDANTIRKILPLVTLSPSAGNYADQPLIKRITTAENHYLVLRANKTLERKSGFRKNDKPAFAGSPYQWLIKYRSSRSKDFSLGLTMEKDAGERFTWKPGNHQFGPDFWSFHFTLRNRGKLKNLTIGDYKLQLGQGVLFAAGFYPGKGTETITTIRRSNLGIVPYTSAAENGFLRGAATTYQIGHFAVTTFYSNKMIDANIEYDPVSSAFLVSSIKASGLHRTATEIGQRKSLNEQVGGINITYLSRDQGLTLGQSVSFNKRSHAPNKPDRIYKKFANGEKTVINLGYNFSYNWENLHFFGEWALGNTGGYGLVLGVLANFSPKVQSSLLFRKYGVGFHTFYGDAFSENSDNNNESGFYWGLKLLPFKKFTITGFMDIFQFPWLKFQVDRPSTGHELLLAFSYKPSKGLKITGLLRQENKAVNYADGPAKLNSIVTRKRSNYQLTLHNGVNDLLSFKSNLQ